MQQPHNNTKLIRVSIDTHSRLVEIGRYGENMDNIISRCLDIYEKVNKKK